MPESAVLNPRTVDWLLERADPAVRHMALRPLLDRPDDDPEAVESRNAALVDIERQGHQSKWVTLRALRYRRAAIGEEDSTKTVHGLT